MLRRRRATCGPCRRLRSPARSSPLSEPRWRLSGVSPRPAQWGFFLPARRTPFHRHPPNRRPIPKPPYPAGPAGPAGPCRTRPTPKPTHPHTHHPRISCRTPASPRKSTAFSPITHTPPQDHCRLLQARQTGTSIYPSTPLATPRRTPPNQPPSPVGSKIKVYALLERLQ